MGKGDKNWSPQNRPTLKKEDLNWEKGSNPQNYQSIFHVWSLRSACDCRLGCDKRIRQCLQLVSSGGSWVVEWMSCI